MVPAAARGEDTTLLYLESIRLIFGHDIFISVYFSFIITLSWVLGALCFLFLFLLVRGFYFCFLFLFCVLCFVGIEIYSVIQHYTIQ